MKPADAALIALLGTGSFVECDLYTITLSDDSVLRYAVADVDVAVSIDIFGVDDVFALADIFLTNTYLSTGPLFDDPNNRATGSWRIGLDVDTWQVRVIPRARDAAGNHFPDKIGTTGWLAAAAGGFFDGAIVQVDRAFLEAWPTPWVRTVPVLATGTVLIFLGRMAEVDVGRTEAILNVNDYRELLSMLMPHNLFQSGCRHTLFDAGCSLSKAAFAQAGVVNAVDSNQITTSLPFAAGYFNLGSITMTSGENEGFNRAVRSWDGVTLTLIAPFYYDVQIGDTFNAYPGCDKTSATCASKYANSDNFGGQKYIPAPEAAI